MAGSTIVIIAHFTATSQGTRDKILDHLHGIAEYSRVNEPGILKYAICLPDNAQDVTSVYIIEEYTDKIAFDAHMSLPALTTFLGALQDSAQPLVTPPINAYHVSWTPALLSRADRLPSNATKTTAYDLRARVENPYILFATITDPDVEDINTLEPYGAAIVEYATKNEPDTIFYADARPSKSNEVAGMGAYICAVEVYASKEACMKHLQDESVKNLTIEGHKLGSKFEIVQLVMKEGWLVRE